MGIAELAKAAVHLHSHWELPGFTLSYSESSVFCVFRQAHVWVRPSKAQELKCWLRWKLHATKWIIVVIKAGPVPGNLHKTLGCAHFAVGELEQIIGDKPLGTRGWTSLTADSKHQYVWCVHNVLAALQVMYVTGSSLTSLHSWWPKASFAV